MSGPRTVCAPEGIPVTSLTARAIAVAVAATVAAAVVVVVVVVAVVVVTRPTTLAGPSKFSTRTRPRSVPLGVCSCSGGVASGARRRDSSWPPPLPSNRATPRPTPLHRPVSPPTRPPYVYNIVIVRPPPPPPGTLRYGCSRGPR